MEIKNNDHARELIAAAGINTITVTTRQLKSLHKHVDACMRASGNYNGTYRMDKVGTDPRYCTCSTEQWESREAFSFNRDGFIGFAGWADKSNTRPILDGVALWLEELSKSKRKLVRPFQVMQKAWLWMDPESDYPFYQDERVTIGETLSKAKSSLFSELQDAGYLCEFADIFSIKFLRDKNQDKVLIPPAPILEQLTSKQRHIIGHANGNGDREPGWRDYYCTTDGNEDCERLVSLGLMKRGRVLESVSTSRYYLLTEAGAQAALSDAIIPRSVAERMIPWQPHLLEKGLLSLKAIKDNPSLLESMGNPMCRIYSAEWGYYWRPKGAGYGSQSEAGMYSFQNAYMTTKHCGPEKQIWYEFAENAEVAA